MAGSTLSRIRLTKTVIATLPVPVSGRAYHYDDLVPGLAVCITAAGVRTFYLCRRIARRYTRVRLGRFGEIGVEQARRLASAVNGDVAQGHDPQAAKRAARSEATFKDLCDLWLTRARQRKRTWLEDERLINKHLTNWSARALSSISRLDVQRLHQRIGRSAPYVANRVVALISTMFNRADELGFVGPNPASKIEHFQEVTRDRFLQPDELRRFFAALAEELDDTIRDFFLVCLFTGARRGNVMTMRWQDVDLERAMWRIPQTKSGEPLYVPLVDPAIEILSARAAARGDDNHWVFPGRYGRGHFAYPYVAWNRILKRAAIEDLRIHDLRRTLGSWQAITGASLPIIGKSLGHKLPSTTAIYARLTVDPVREATAKAAQAMLVAGGLVREKEDQ